MGKGGEVGTSVIVSIIKIKKNKINQIKKPFLKKSCVHSKCTFAIQVSLDVKVKARVSAF